MGGGFGLKGLCHLGVRTLRTRMVRGQNALRPHCEHKPKARYLEERDSMRLCCVGWLQEKRGANSIIVLARL